MEGIIKVTPEKLVSTSNEFNLSGHNIQTVTSEMMNEIRSLPSIWMGDASAAYIAKFNCLDDDIRRMIGMVNEHVQDLLEMAATYNNAESQNIDSFSNLSSDVIV